jgi:DNA modification methylase
MKSNMSFELRCGDVLSELANISDQTFDFIFADPPYGLAQKEFEKIISLSGYV